MVISINNQDSSVHWDGFVALSIVYGVFSFSNFLVPSILSMFSSARCLFFASLTYLAYTMIFLHPIRYELEIVSAIVGFGAAGTHFRSGLLFVPIILTKALFSFQSSGRRKAIT